MLALLTVAIGAWLVSAMVLWRDGQLLDPTVLASLVYSLVAQMLILIALLHRPLWAAPALMTVVVLVALLQTTLTSWIISSDIAFLVSLVNILAMLAMWVSFATEEGSSVARWLHPWRPVRASTSEPPEMIEADLEMSPFDRIVMTRTRSPLDSQPTAANESERG